jgi:hypothetical protein
MDNEFSAPSLVLPAVPSDFEKKCGTSKTDFVNAVFELLESAKIAGLEPSEPLPYDLAALSAQVETNTAAIAKLNLRTIRRQILAGVNNGLVVVPFQDIGTVNYSVGLAYVTPNINFDPIQWSIVANSKQTNQVQLRLDGRSGTFQIEVTIISMDGI